MLNLSEHEFWDCLSPVTVCVLVKTSLCVLSRTGMHSLGILISFKALKVITAIGSGRFSFGLCCVYEITRLKVFMQWVYNGVQCTKNIFPIVQMNA